MTHDLIRHRAEVARAIRNHDYDITPEGMYLPKQKAIVGGVFEVTHRRNGDMLAREAGPNLLPTQGLNHMLDVTLHGSAQITPWYVALFSGNVTPGATLTGATFAAVTTEFTNYAETTRVAYDEAAASGGVTDNTASRSIFTINGAGGTVYGGALLSASAKGAAGASDICLAAARFSTSRAVVSGDELAVRYTITLTSA